MSDKVFVPGDGVFRGASGILPIDTSDFIRCYTLSEGQGAWLFDRSYTGSTRSSHQMSELRQTIDTDPDQRHHFDPAHHYNISEVNLSIDGAERTYVAYDSDQSGNRISLYYADDLDNWSEYSGNPILSGTDQYRWPSPIYKDGTIHLFQNNRANKQIERWTSTDGINFTKQENVLTGPTDTNNPDVFYNPNDDKYWLFWKSTDDGTSTGDQIINARSAATISGLSSASDTDVGLPPKSIQAAPTCFPINGRYWLITEVKPGNWWMEIWYSDTIDSGYTQVTNNDVLGSWEDNVTTDSAVPALRRSKDGTYRVFYNMSTSSSTWLQRHRRVFEGTAAPNQAGRINRNGVSWVYDSTLGRYVLDYSGGAGSICKIPSPSTFSAFTAIAISQKLDVNDGNVGQDIMLNNNNSFYMRYEGDGTYRTYIKDGSGTQQGEIPSGGASASDATWTMWVFKWDGSNYDFRKNKTSLETGSFTGTTASGNSNQHNLGATTSSSEQLDGKQAFAAVANIAISNTRLDRIYDKILGG